MMYVFMYVCMYVCMYYVFMYVCMYLCLRFRGASPVYPTPCNREIGCVSSSFFLCVPCVSCEAGRSCAGAGRSVVLIAWPPGC